MDRQKSVFWTLIIVFSILVTGYVVWIFSHPNRVVSDVKYIEEFETHGVPDFTLPLFDAGKGALDSKQFKLSENPAAVTLVNFWATWCAPCQTEFPSLVELSKKFENDPRFKIVAISEDRNLQDVAAFLGTGKKPSGNNFAVVVDLDGSLAQQYGTKKLPETFIVGKDRKLIRKVIADQNWVSPEFLGFLNGLLGGQK